ncbi:hypothetical protein INR49_017200 [Scomber scombrus]|uniref:NADH dehydrogenase subunit 6 n=1 Tax=Scomber scombrus TaxID=13677 RepID=A0AAV1QBL8_SCOSC
MAATIRIFISLLLISHFSKAQKPGDDSFYSSLIMVFSVSPLSLISLLLLGLTVILSGSVYFWVLRYVCIGCCQPVVIGPESQTLAGMV